MQPQSGVLAVAAATGLDWVLGDPRRMLHPVVVMGWWIQTLRRALESWAQDNTRKLRFSGGLITLVLVCSSGLLGWGIEWLSRITGPWGWPVLVIALASALAGRSLHDSVIAVLQALPEAVTAEPTLARQKLSWIVGRDVSQLDRGDIPQGLCGNRFRERRRRAVRAAVLDGCRLSALAPEPDGTRTIDAGLDVQGLQHPRFHARLPHRPTALARNCRCPSG